MELRVEAPEPVRAIATAIAAAGGRAWIVGGAARDAVRGAPPKDWDLEVYGLEASELGRLLRRLGPTRPVGRAFGVFLVQRQEMTVEVALPRPSGPLPLAETPEVRGDPWLPPEQAARRRDLSVNALMLDPLTGELLDPCGGLADLEARRLAPADPATFLDDPVRALRVGRFAARFGFSTTPELRALCAVAPLDGLPAERVLAEWVGTLEAARPSLGLTHLRDTGLEARLFPELRPHSESGPALDRLVDVALAPGRALAARLAAWLRATPDPEPTLDRLGLKRWAGYPVRRQLPGLIAWLDRPLATVASQRHAAAATDLRALLALREAFDHAPPSPEPEPAWLDAPPAPIFTGADAAALGLASGPAMGALLAAVYHLQLDGQVVDAQSARREAERLLAARD